MIKPYNARKSPQIQTVTIDFADKPAGLRISEQSTASFPQSLQNQRVKFQKSDSKVRVQYTSENNPLDTNSDLEDLIPDTQEGKAATVSVSAQ